MTRVTQIFVDGRCVLITRPHIEVAQLIYTRRPHIWGGDPNPCAWDEAPARVQIEFLELAHAVLAHPVFKAAGGACQIGPEG